MFLRNLNVTEFHLTNKCEALLRKYPGIEFGVTNDSNSSEEHLGIGIDTQINMSVIWKQKTFANLGLY